MPVLKQWNATNITYLNADTAFLIGSGTSWQGSLIREGPGGRRDRGLGTYFTIHNSVTGHSLSISPGL